MGAFETSNLVKPKQGNRGTGAGLSGNAGKGARGGVVEVPPKMRETWQHLMHGKPSSKAIAQSSKGQGSRAHKKILLFFDTRSPYATSDD